LSIARFTWTIFVSFTSGDRPISSSCHKSLNTLRGVRFFRCDDGEHETYLDLFREQGVNLETFK